MKMKYRQELQVKLRRNGIQAIDFLKYVTGNDEETILQTCSNKPVGYLFDLINESFETLSEVLGYKEHPLQNVLTFKAWIKLHYYIDHGHTVQWYMNKLDDLGLSYYEQFQNVHDMIADFENCI